MDHIYEQFAISSQLIESRYQIFETIGNWSVHLNNFVTKQDETSYNAVADISPNIQDKLNSLFIKETDTWNLISSLYFLRLAQEQNAENDAIDEKKKGEGYLMFNEMASVKRFLESDPALKEIVIIQDWLESNYSRLEEPDLLAKFIYWEQTLEVLKNDKLIGQKGYSTSLVRDMDPDAVYRDGKEIHIYDTEEELKVQKSFFYYLRSGQPEKGFTYLRESGHHVKAGMFSGYMYSSRDYENKESDKSEHNGDGDSKMNEENNMLSNETDEFSVNGNTERDMWKSLSFSICDTAPLLKYERASLGLLCGNRSAIMDACNTWEDKIWAYIRVIRDIRIEAELRKERSGSLIPMPEEYWNQDMTLAEAMNKVMVPECDILNNYQNIYYLVQKHVITDDITTLLQKISETLKDLIRNMDSSIFIGQLLRFLTHLLLAFGIVGLPYDENLMNECTEAYIKVLVRNRKLVFIPYYVEKLSEERQIPVIKNHINTDEDVPVQDIADFISAAKLNNLDILKIAVEIVGKIRDDQENFNIQNLYWISSCYDYVEDPRHVMLAFLQNTLILIRKYLILNNIQKCFQLIGLIEQSCIDEVISLNNENDETLVREFLCYTSYLKAEEALSLWQMTLQQRPNDEILTDEPMGDMSIADQALFEKKQADLRLSREKWTKAYRHHLKICIGKYFEMLRFPGGWLVNCVSITDKDEFNNMKAVRRILIPKIIFILLKLLMEQKCIKTVREFVYILTEDYLEILKELTAVEIGSVFKIIEELDRTLS